MTVRKRGKPNSLTQDNFKWYPIQTSQTVTAIDDYAEDGGPREVWILCSFYHEPLRTWLKTNINKFAISNHIALKLAIDAPRSYLKLTFEY